MLLLVLPLMACEHLTNLSGSKVPVREVACRAFKPITWSAQDSDETLLQVKEHNAAWLALCKKV